MKEFSFRFAAVLAGLFALGFPREVLGEEQRFQFRVPYSAAYRIELPAQPSQQALAPRVQWLAAKPEDGSTNLVLFGSRVVLQLDSPDDLKRLTDGHPLELARTVSSNVFIFQAPDAATAMREAARLAALPEVLASYPVMKRQGDLRGPYAPRTDDEFFIPYFSGGFSLYDAQWYLENIDYNGMRLGYDLNVLAAWPYSKGQGVTVAVADSGLEINHPELTNRIVGAPHFNFGNDETNAAPIGGDKSDFHVSLWTHGTSVGGLIAAQGNNRRGMVGVAPEATLAGWVIFTTNVVVETVQIDETNFLTITNLLVSLVSDEQLMEMYQYAPDAVAIQNHSWGSAAGKAQGGPTLLEQIGIANAATLGRQGRGTVMVRAAGNGGGFLASSNDDNYPNDPHVVTVTAVEKSGRATDYSEPGACILVAAPGGNGNNSQKIFTLDLVGVDRGVNAFVNYNPPDLSDYRWGIQAFAGTSASAPLVSGIAALMLSVNPNLGYRDVQHILALSGKHYDLADPGIATNGAGLAVSHNVGYGIPDAAHAVWLAGIWSNRPALTTLTLTDTTTTEVPDEGLRVQVTGDNIPVDLESIQCFPSLGPHADEPTRALPLVDIGLATNVPAVNLTNKGALVLRGGTDFNTKIANAAAAGAEFVVMYNWTNDNVITFELVVGTAFSAIPAVMVSNSKGELLKSVFETNASALARIHLDSADRVFNVNTPLLCEQVGVRVQMDHPNRGELRITLLSPGGTRSVLQHLNDDITPGPADWTYWSTHHLMEPGAGEWRVSISDEAAGNIGSIRSVSLILRGTQITDTDGDGLDDSWEMTRLGSLAGGPQDDPDNDGFNNAREQVMYTNPQLDEREFIMDLSPWELFGLKMARLSWPSSPNFNYEILSGTNAAVLNAATNLPGAFWETSWFTPIGGVPQQFYRVQSLSNP